MNLSPLHLNFLKDLLNKVDIHHIGQYMTWPLHEIEGLFHHVKKEVTKAATAPPETPKVVSPAVVNLKEQTKGKRNG